MNAQGKRERSKRTRSGKGVRVTLDITGRQVFESEAEAPATRTKDAPAPVVDRARSGGAIIGGRAARIYDILSADYASRNAQRRVIAGSGVFDTLVQHDVDAADEQASDIGGAHPARGAAGRALPGDAASPTPLLRSVSGGGGSIEAGFWDCSPGDSVNGDRISVLLDKVAAGNVSVTDLAGQPRADASVEREATAEDPALASQSVEALATRVHPQDAGNAMSERACICVDQPLASLLVAGVARFIPAVWETEHRGPIWVISTAYEPTTAEIRAAETRYATATPASTRSLPDTYPTRALVGRVDVVEALSAAQYRSEALDVKPGPESDAPFVWYCDHPAMTRPASAMRRSFDLAGDVLQLLSSALLRAARKSTTDVDVSWRPSEALKSGLG